MKNINLINLLDTISKIYPQAYYDKRYSWISIPIAKIQKKNSLLTKDIRIDIASNILFLCEGMHSITYSYDEYTDEDDIIRIVDKYYSFITDLLEGNPNVVDNKLLSQGDTQYVKEPVTETF